MTPGEAFTILKAKFMTHALQAKSDLFDELGCYSTEDFIYRKKEYVAPMQLDVNEIKPMKCKSLEVSYILSLNDWIVEYSFLFAWTVLELQDFTEWRSNSTLGTPVLPAPSPATPSIPHASLSPHQKELVDFN
jgi:hypothetical protein